MINGIQTFTFLANWSHKHERGDIKENTQKVVETLDFFKMNVYSVKLDHNQSSSSKILNITSMRRGTNACVHDLRIKSWVEDES